MPDKPRAIIADDHALIAAGLQSLLKTHIDIIAVVHDGRSVVREAIALQPDIVLLDIAMPLLNGIEAARQVHSWAPKTKIIFVTQKTEREYLRAAFGAGARGYVLKQAAAADLVEAISQVQEGQCYLSPGIAQDLGADLSGKVISIAAGVGGALTPRQREVLQLVAEGKTAKEIAHLLNISVKTVEFHKSAIMGQLGLRTTAELTRYALEHRIVGD